MSQRTHPLHAPSAEDQLIGTVILRPEVLHELPPTLSAANFYAERSIAHWRAIEAIRSRGGAIDSGTLRDEHERLGTLQLVGGLEGIFALTQVIPATHNAIQHAAEIIDKSHVKTIRDVCLEIAAAADDPNLVAAEYSDSAQQRILAACERRDDDRDTQSVGEIFADFVDALESGVNPALPTGFCDLDRALAGGMRGGELLTFAGRPGMGKTSIATQIAMHAASTGPVFVASQEMTRQQVVQRMASLASGVTIEAMRQRSLNDLERARIRKLGPTFQALPIDVSDAAGLTPMALRAKVRRCRRRRSGLSLVVVDYLQLMRVPGARNREQEVAEISRSLKSLAKELDVPVLALAQLNRRVDEAGDRRPHLSSLRDSGQLEQDADAIVFIYRDEVYNPGTPDLGIAELIVAKQRDGGTGTVKVRFDGPCARFDSLARRPEPFWHEAEREEMTV